MIIEKEFEVFEIFKNQKKRFQQTGHFTPLGHFTPPSLSDVIENNLTLLKTIRRY